MNEELHTLPDTLVLKGANGVTHIKSDCCVKAKRFFREKFKAFEGYCFYELFVLSFFSWFCHVSGFALAMAMSAYLFVCLPLWSGHSWSKKSILRLK